MYWIDDNKFRVFIYKPSEELFERVCNYINKKGFSLESGEKDVKRASFRRDASEIKIQEREDIFGKYIYMLCKNVSQEEIRRELSVCPNCNSRKVRILSVPPCWRNEVTERLYSEGKMEYGPGAYDRLGTSPPNNHCVNCGLRWSNSVDYKYWSYCIKKNLMYVILNL